MRRLLFLALVGCGSSDPMTMTMPDAGTTPADDGSTPVTDSANGDSNNPSDSIAPMGVPMFLGIGYEGRTTISCDDGKTWVGNRSDDDTLRCFSPTDCDHDGRAGRGVAFAHGWFVADFGWGNPGTIRRSKDGVKWDTVLTGPNFASMMFGNGQFVGASRQGRISNDDGMTWSMAGEAMLTFNNMTVWNVRRGGFGGSGLFLLIGDGPTAAVSPDAKSWTVLQNLPSQCGANIQWAGGIASANKTFVVVDGNGYACASIDDGKSWMVKNLGQMIGGRLLWTGSEYVTWSSQQIFRSKDGINWTGTPTKTRNPQNMVTNGAPIGPVAVSPSGTFVAANDGWQVWYEKQKFYRSTDGVTWDELPAGTFTGSHPMTHMIWATADPGTVCPQK